MDRDERDLLEKQLAQKAAWSTMNREDLQDWRNCEFTNKYRGHKGKTLIVWEHTNSEPKILDVFKVTELVVSLVDGYSVYFENEDCEEFEITHTPVRLGKYNFFLHVPYMQDTQYLPNKGGTANVLRFPFVVRQKGRPKLPVLGEVYLMDVIDFVSSFPQFADRKF